MTNKDQASRMRAALERTVPTDSRAPVSIRIDDKRLTVDIRPDLHEQTKRWAFENDVALVAAIRLFLERLVTDPELSEQYLRELKR